MSVADNKDLIHPRAERWQVAGEAVSTRSGTAILAAISRWIPDAVAARGSPLSYR
jgi:hypothetical protein